MHDKTRRGQVYECLKCDLICRFSSSSEAAGGRRSSRSGALDFRAAFRCVHLPALHTPDLDCGAIRIIPTVCLPGGRIRVDASFIGAQFGHRDDDDEGDEFYDDVDAQIEEEEEEYASLIGTRGVKDRSVQGIAGWTTKHDARVSGRRNVRRLEAKFPQEVGNLSGIDAKISNRVSGDLSRHFSKRTRKGVSRTGRVEAAALQTQEGVLDGA